MFRLTRFHARDVIEKIDQKVSSAKNKTGHKKDKGGGVGWGKKNISNIEDGGNKWAVGGGSGVEGAIEKNECVMMLLACLESTAKGKKSKEKNKKYNRRRGTGRKVQGDAKIRSKKEDEGFELENKSQERRLDHAEYVKDWLANLLFDCQRTIGNKAQQA